MKFIYAPDDDGDRLFLNTGIVAFAVRFTRFGRKTFPGEFPATFKNFDRVSLWSRPRYGMTWAYVDKFDSVREAVTRGLWLAEEGNSY